MENEVKNSIALANTTNISTDLFGGNTNSRKVTSLNLNDESQMDMFINSQQEADFKLNDKVGETITFIGATITEYYSTDVNDSGEEVTRRKHTLCLFDEDGKSYVTGSNSCYYSFANIVSFKGMPTVEKPIKLEIVKVPAETKGHEYLKVKLAK